MYSINKGRKVIYNMDHLLTTSISVTSHYYLCDKIKDEMNGYIAHMGQMRNAYKILVRKT
jgi:hypothetical protein